MGWKLSGWHLGERPPAIALILIITFFSFYPSLKNDFVNWDDGLYVTANYTIQHLSWVNLRQIFGSFFAGNYHPLTLLTYACGYSLFKLNPLGYHLINLILHLLNCLLVFWLFYLLTRKIPVSLITAIFFGIHPLHVESVVWISETKDVLYALFYLAAIICYCYYLREARARKYYYLSLVLFILSLLSKATAMTLPLALFLIDYLTHRKSSKMLFMDKIPFLIISFFFGIITIFGQCSAEVVVNKGLFNISHKIAIPSYSIIFYLKKIFLPIKLSCFYPFPEMKTFFTYTYPSLIVVLFLIAVIISGRYTRKIIFGSVFFLVTILPVIQFIPFGSTMVSDRYVYIPLIGISYLLAEGFARLYTISRKYMRFALLLLLIAIMGVLSSLTYKRTQVWKDSVTLWNDALKNYTHNSSSVYNNRGMAYFNAGELEPAFSDYNKAIELDPNFADAYCNRGNAYLKKGDVNLAISDYDKAIEINSRYAKAYNNRGNAYFNKGDINQAISDYTKTIELNPKAADAYCNRGNAYLKKGDTDLALSDYNKAIEIKPDFMEAYYNRGNAYLNKGNLNLAISDYTKTIELNPNLANAYYNRGNAYLNKGDLYQAISDYNEAIELNPDLASAYYNRGNAYLNKGDLGFAISDYNKTIEINSGDANAYNSRGLAYLTKGDLTFALSDYNKAIELQPNCVEAYYNRAVAYHEKKQYGRCWKDVHQAESLGYKIEPEFLQKLKKDSGREK